MLQLDYKANKQEQEVDDEQPSKNVDRCPSEPVPDFKIRHERGIYHHEVACAENYVLVEEVQPVIKVVTVRLAVTQVD